MIIIGIVIVQPIAPMGIYGIINNEARGHVVTAILIAMVLEATKPPDRANSMA